MNLNITVLPLNNSQTVKKELIKIGSDPVGLRIMESKAIFRAIKIERLRSKAANLLKQTFLGKGGDVALGRGSADLSEEYTDALIIATVQQYRQSIPQLKMQPWGLSKLAQQLEQVLAYLDDGLPRRTYRWTDRTLILDGEHSVVMGILNLTPDSFSDGGQYNSLEMAIRRVEEMQADGADIIDIGAESTRPYEGAAPVTAQDEIARLLPALEKIIPYCKVPISVDTYKASVAEAALQSGAHIINDIWGLQYDPAMAEVAAKYAVPVVIMHNKQEFVYSTGIMQDIQQGLQKSIQLGIENGIKSENIIIDPGIGFAKTFAHNMEIMAKLEQLQSLGCPILLGTSRKKFIGQVLDLPVDQRVEGTIATAALGKVKGVQIHRVHDVKAVKRTLTMMDRMMRSGENDEDFN